MKWLKLILLGLIPLTAFLYLPTEVISHWDFYGKPNDWMSRNGLMTVFLIMGIFGAYVPDLVLKMSGKSFSASKRWTTAAFGYAFAVWTLLFWLLVVHANTSGDGKLSNLGVWGISVIFLIPVAPLMFEKITHRKTHAGG